MNLKLIFNLFTIFVLFKKTNAQIPSLPPGAAIAPEGVPHGPPGTINEETIQPPTNNKPSEEEVIGR